jgi:hypothetical protein
MKKNKKIWFPAKKYGVGWGLPLAWQGWAVLIGYVVLVVSGPVMFCNAVNLLWFLPFLFGFSVLLFLICRKRGEKPQLRWGDKIK